MKVRKVAGQVASRVLFRISKLLRKIGAQKWAHKLLVRSFKVDKWAKAGYWSKVPVSSEDE